MKYQTIVSYLSLCKTPTHRPLRTSDHLVIKTTNRQVSQLYSGYFNSLVRPPFHYDQFSPYPMLDLLQRFRCIQHLRDGVLSSERISGLSDQKQLLVYQQFKLKYKSDASCYVYIFSVIVSLQNAVVRSYHYLQMKECQDNSKYTHLVS